MTQMNYSLVIFDCDGTLVDSETVNNQGLCEELTRDGLPQYTVAYAMDNFVGIALPDIMKKIASETGHVFGDDFRDRVGGNVNARLQNGISAISGAQDVLMNLVAQNIPVCVASNGRRSNVINSLIVTELMPFFGEDKVFTKDQVGDRGKPAPDLFLFAAAQMGNVPSDQCLVIEDSATGARAAVAAKMDVLGFTGSAHDKPAKTTALNAEHVTHIIDDLRAIPGHVITA